MLVQVDMKYTVLSTDCGHGRKITVQHASSRTDQTKASPQTHTPVTRICSSPFYTW